MGLTLWDQYGSYMGVPIWEIRIHPSLGPYGNANWATKGPLLAYLYALVRIGTIWDAHVGLAVWDHHTWGHIGLLSGPYMGPLWAAHMGLAVWDPYGSYMGLPI